MTTNERIDEILTILCACDEAKQAIFDLIASEVEKAKQGEPK